MDDNYILGIVFEMLYNRNIDLNNPDDSLALLYNFVAGDSYVLDVGCAGGELAKILHQNKNAQIVGMEYDNEAVKLCRKNGAFEGVIKIDLNKLKAKDFPIFKNHFDYIILGDVLEHLYNPSEVMQELLCFLKDDGYFLLSIPNIAHASIKANLLLNDWNYTELGILDKTHIRFFTADSIINFLGEHRLLITELVTTKLYIDGYQKHKVDELPAEIFDFIVKDAHSHVFQYVLKAKKSDLGEGKIKRINAEFMNIKSAKKYVSSGLMYKLKRLLLLKFPNLVKYIQKMR